MTIIPNKKLYHRRSIRLPGYDYSEVGCYFITILVHGREPIFGTVIEDEVHLTPAGLIVWDVWKSIPKKYPQVDLDISIVMPNHFHAIITINDSPDVLAKGVDPPEVRAIHELPLQIRGTKFDGYEHNSSEVSEFIRKTRRRMLIPKVVGYFKMQTGKKINELRNTPGQPVWHRNYYEHIICDDNEFEAISVYIEYNPSNWRNNDEYFLKPNSD